MPKLLWICRLLSLGVGGALLLGTSLAPSASAENLYRWVTEDGVVSYTDEERRIPARYRENARATPSKGLAQYPRYTPADAEATTAYAEQLAARLERLRALSAGDRADATSSAGEDRGASQSRISLRTAGEEPTIEVDLAEQGSQPVLVERMRVRDRDSMTTRHVTVVRQGDRIISVVDGRKWTEGTSSGDLQDLLGR